MRKVNVHCKDSHILGPVMGGGDSVGCVISRHVARVRVSLVLSEQSPSYDPLVPVSGSLSLSWLRVSMCEPLPQATACSLPVPPTRVKLK